MDRGIAEAYSLSPMQQGMLFHSLYAPGSGVDIEQVVGILYERIDVPAFERAWRRVVQRHPVLRTSFRWEGLDRPIQEVHRYARCPLEQQNWHALSEVEREIRLDAYLRQDRKRGFELQQPPLMRLALFNYAEAEYRLIWTFHHILLDGRSFPLVLQEVFAFYEAFRQGRDLKLDCPRPYRDHIEWLKRQDVNAEAFWRQLLDGFAAPTPLTVGGAFTEPSKDDETYGIQKIQLSPALTSDLESLARRHQLTLNTLVQAAWGLLLGRYSVSEDVVFGATRACRRSTLDGADSMVGLFINTLPVRARLAPEASVLAYLKALRAQSLAVREYEHTPLVQVQEWSDVPRGMSLFESILVFEHQSLNATLQALGGDWGHREFGLVEQTNYALTLLAYGGPSLTLHLSYDRRRFVDAAIDRMLGHLQALLQGFAANPNQRLSHLPILTGPEQRQLLVEWNNLEVAGDDDLGNRCVHQLFEAQASHTPDAVAVVFGDQEFTYRELDRRANQLAHHLRSLGVGPEALVGICVERSFEMIIGLLGILKAGGAYVPLDPTYPRERLAFMMEDVRISVLLTQQALTERLPTTQASTVCLDADWKTIARRPAENPFCTVTTDNLAYVLFTSGSTGLPKGVAIAHRNATAMLSWARRVFAPGDLAGVLASTSINFDLSVFELFLPLSCGGKAILTKDILHLPTLPAARQVTLINTVPSAMAELLRMGTIPPSVRVVNLAGEPLRGELVQQVYRQSGAQRVFDLYGPSEDTTYSTFALRSADGPETIGRPIAGTQIYLLDPYLNPVPVGVPGELYVGGAGLARGYLNRAALTAERFVPDPFAGVPGGRLYKTGDLARYRPDGNLEFLGRIDYQVKIRGFRIELGEVEMMLAQHPAVRDTVVTAHEYGPGDTRLVGYVVLHQGQGAARDTLRDFLRGKLPSYMIPSAFVPLKALPLTPNGKVDRRALPALGAYQPGSGKGFVPPRTPTEEVLASIWIDILGAKKVGANDNFFELGGHSLLATRVVSRIREAFEVDLPLRELFDVPTLAGLAERIEATQQAVNNLRLSAANMDAPITPVPRTADIPLSFAQQRLWFLDQLEGPSAIYNIPVALHLDGPLDVTALEQSLAEIVRRHEALRTVFAVVDGSSIQVVIPPRPVPLSLFDLQDSAATERKGRVRQLIAEEVRRPFNLEQGPLLRISLLQIDPAEHILLVVMHHIISDGWSVGVFFKELTVLYEAFLVGQPSPLPELPFQCVDFAYWQRQRSEGDADPLGAQLAYWKQQLAGAPPVLRLPTDRPRPSVMTYRGRVERFELDAHLVRRLETLGRQSGTTLFMAFLATFAVLLGHYSGQEDIVVGSPIANRNRKEIEPLIGFFVNTLALRIDLSGNPTFREMLGRVRGVALDAYANQDVPFEQLVEALHPERDLSHTALFQVMFVMQGTPLAPSKLAGLTVSPMEVDTGTAKFDLTLFIEEKGDGLVGMWEYSADLFEMATIAQMTVHFVALLERVVANPDRHLSELPLLTEAERHRLLVEWNDTRVDYPQDQCIHHLFEAQAERTPEAIAVACEGKTLTYRELNQRANRLAHYLRRLGVGPEVVVGIYLVRSLEMVVGLLGVLKAGGAYMPLDLRFPPTRIARMLEDARSPVLLIKQSPSEELAKQAHLVHLDADRETIARESAENPASCAAAGNLVYVLFTSGSTGRSKGVAIEHRQLTNYLRSILEKLDPNPGASFALVSTFSADLGNTMIFPSLCTGGCLHIVPRERASDPEALADYFHQHPADYLKVVPSHLSVLLSASRPERILPRRRLVLGGEATKWDLVRELLSLAPDCAILNHYGPTETTVGVVVHHPTRDRLQQEIEDMHSLTLPLGRPLANAQIYLLNPSLQPVPVGVPGELYIGGNGVGRGYLNRPALTAERFVPDPFGDRPGARLYRTGDLARYLADGTIEFLGRVDFQVKIRGFRVELGEIEATLLEHPAVQNAVVVAHEVAHLPGEQRLAAYIATGQRHKPTLNELLDFLRHRLPDYMVPSAFVVLDAIPLTPNGKIDRRALPVPEVDRSELEVNYVMPRNPLEEKLAAIWADVLGISHVGIHDNFFDLGGHSLQAVRLVSKIAAATNHELSVKAIFLHPTVSALAVSLGDSALGDSKASPGEVDSTVEKRTPSVAPRPDQARFPSHLLEVQRRPLLSLLAMGKIGPVDSAAIGYLQRASFASSNRRFILDWFDDLPLFTNVWELSLGRIAIILLPRFDLELYADEEDLLNLLVEALEISKHLGAQVVSLTGLIPSATDYGRAVASAIADRQDLPAITTGHATTTASVILAIKRILEESGRDMGRERVGFLGLGSIGAASLRLMLKHLPHPPEIILCDLYSELDAVERIRHEIITGFGFQGSVHIAASRDTLPPEFYDATLIVGATNVPDILDIDRVTPGTLVVDDSGPHCFKTESAIRRFETQGDILFTEGGVLRSPQPVKEIRYVPKEAAHIAELAELERFLSRGFRNNPYVITGCVLSSLLSTRFEDLRSTLGLVDAEAGTLHYETLDQLGFRSADLHCKHYTLVKDAVRSFRRRYGNGDDVSFE